MLLLGVLSIGACDAGPVGRADATPGNRDDSLVVASFNFPESELVAEMYAAALEHAGVPVRREFNLGPRELVIPALLQGHIDLVPEYTGTALASLRNNGAPTPAVPPDADAVAELAGRLESYDVRVLTPSPAQNQNAVVVRRDTAETLGLSSVSSLAPHAAGLTVGGPPECPQRPYCLAGLEAHYSLRFSRFMALDGAERTARALHEGVVDVGIMFTTDGHLAARGLVALEDDAHLQPPDHVVPVVRSAALATHGPEVAVVLDEVSARLTTTALRLLNWRVAVAGNEPRAEAVGWLVRQGLLPR